MRRSASMTPVSLAVFAGVAIAFVSPSVLGQTTTGRIQRLEGAPLPKARWENAGFATPSATAETFMWATREGDVDVLLACWLDSEVEQKRKEIQEDRAAFEEKRREASLSAEDLEILAIKRIDGTTVELKFRVDGWGEEAFVHRLIRDGEKWLLSGSTRRPDW